MRAFDDFLFERPAVRGQPFVAIANGAKHRIEAVDQNADLLIARPIDAHIVSMISLNLLHGGEQPTQRTRDDPLKPPCDEQSDRQGRKGGKHDRPKPRQQARPKVHRVADQIDPTDLFAAVDNRHGNENGIAAQQAENGRRRFAIQ